MKKPSVAVVILNWNGKNYLEKFLSDVIKYSSEDAEIIVADNASTDDSVSFLKKTFPEIRIITMSENTGYTGGYNKALKQIDSDYYILLNSDIEVTSNWIKPIIEIMEADKSIAACQPKILDYNNRQKFEYAGAGGGFIDFLGYPFCRGRIFDNIEDDKNQYDDIIEIFWATGACMFLRADSFKKAGGLDDDFFAHMEEIDLCWRFQRMGLKVMYCGKSMVYHVGGGTLPKNNSKKTYYNFRNNLFLLLKNLSAIKLLMILLIRPALDLLAAFVFLIKGNYKDFLAVHKAWLCFFAKALKMRRKGFKFEKKTSKNIYYRSIVFDFYLLGFKTFDRIRKSCIK